MSMPRRQSRLSPVVMAGMATRRCVATRARPRALSRPASAPVPAVVCRTLSNWSLEPFHGEFGPELITALPHAYFFHACDKLEATSSCGDLRSLYFFSPKHTVLDCDRFHLWAHSRP